MRANWLSNRVFKSFDDIVDHCCFAWNTLIDQPWKIMSIAAAVYVAAAHGIGLILYMLALGLVALVGLRRLISA
jgi:hypothetical protein